LGAAFSTLGIAEKIDELAALYVPPYQLITKPLTSSYHKPEKGTVVGRVIKLKKFSFRIADPEGKTWEVFTSTGTQITPKRKIEPGSCVLVEGTVSTTASLVNANTLKACPRGVHVLKSAKSPIEKEDAP